jgi:hypothetical protein
VTGFGLAADNMRDWVAMQMLGRTRPDGRPLLSVEEVRDGVIMFEDEGDAERYAGLLEADGHEQVTLAT